MRPLIALVTLAVTLSVCTLVASATDHVCGRGPVGITVAYVGTCESPPVTPPLVRDGDRYRQATPAPTPVGRRCREGGIMRVFTEHGAMSPRWDPPTCYAPCEKQRAEQWTDWPECGGSPVEPTPDLTPVSPWRYGP
jgi:hypothetical protein